MPRTPPAPADEKGTTKGSPRFRRGELVLFDSKELRTTHPEIDWSRVGIVLHCSIAGVGVVMWEDGDIARHVGLFDYVNMKRL